MTLKIVLVATLLIGLSIAGIAIKMFFIRGSEFKKSCGSVDPSTGRKVGCSCSGDGESAGTCRNKEA